MFCLPVTVAIASFAKSKLQGTPQPSQLFLPLISFDMDHDGKLSEREFHDFLIELAKSRVLPDRSKAEHKEPSAASTSTAVATSTPSASSSTQVQVASTSLSSSQGGGGGTCGDLSKELIESFAINGTVMLTVCDWRIFETFGEI